MAELTWPEGTIGIPTPDDVDVRERSWEEVEPFETAYRPAIVSAHSWFDPSAEAVSDGDTFDLAVDLGFDIRGFVATVRLIGMQCGIVNKRLGVNAFETALRGNTTPEMKERGLEAKARVKELMPLNSRVLLRSVKGGSRGSLNRWCGLVMLPSWRLTMPHPGSEAIPAPQAAKWVSLGDVLMMEGFATVWWKGWNRGKARPDR